ncbi:MAG: aminoacetone oxidase family FAD-binding enzyme [Oscillospiraceae bacterium]|nr:aminoacetone oxidase family FAD-binding enzyme [Oscillospiraceae bacterium]
MVLGIIGAGAAGMAAALAAAENKDTQVILVERQARVGRKLQATGNGRCNLTNIHAGKSHYHGEEAAFVEAALREMDVQKTLSWFRSLGLFTVTEGSGKVYPYSDQANSVVDVLRLALDRPNIHLRTGFEVQKLRKETEGFSVSNGEETILCDKLIIACGGLAGTKLGGSMSGYKLLGKLGHKATRLRPSLVQLKSQWGGLASLKGVRANCHVQILHDKQLYAESTGELQFTDYGLSGPVIFEVSRDACQASGKWVAKLDLLPHCTAKELEEELQRRISTTLPMEELLTGILHNRLGRVLTKAAGVKNKQIASELSADEIAEIVRAVKAFEIVLTEPMGMENAQVTAGGVLTRDFDPATMESKLASGLYACGEVLDIDGDCGGYNLQWAWSSGFVAGTNAGKEQL